jgi:hypothetical protein
VFNPFMFLTGGLGSESTATPGFAGPVQQPSKRKGLLDFLSNSGTQDATILPGAQSDPEELAARKRARADAAIMLGSALLKGASKGDFAGALGEGGPAALQAYRGEMELFDQKKRERAKDKLSEEVARVGIDETRSRIKATDATLKRADKADVREDEEWNTRKAGLADIVSQAEGMGLDKKDLVNIKLWSVSPGTYDKAMGALDKAIDRANIPEEQARDLRSKIEAMKAGVIPDQRRAADQEDKKIGLQARSIHNEEVRTGIMAKQADTRVSSGGIGGFATRERVRDDIAAEEGRLRTLYRQEAKDDFERDPTKMISKGPDGKPRFASPDFSDADRRAAQDATRNVYRQLGIAMPDEQSTALGMEKTHKSQDIPASLKQLVGTSGPAYEHALSLYSAGYSWSRIETDLRQRTHFK